VPHGVGTRRGQRERAVDPTRWISPPRASASTLTARRSGVQVGWLAAVIGRGAHPRLLDVTLDATGPMVDGDR
jgi:hypothetical protein